MIALSDIPRDPKTGMLAGTFRLRHRNPEFNGGFPGARFVNGVTVEPVRDPAMRRLVASMGCDLELEAAEPSEIPTQPAPAPERRPARPAPPRQPAPAPEMSKSRARLVATAEARGIEVPEGISTRKLRALLEGNR